MEPAVPSAVRLAIPTELLSLVRLAQLLEAVEHCAVDPHQYRLLAEKLTGELREHQGHEALNRLLAHFPATAELYENLQYAHAGLCRTPLALSLNSELAVRDLLERVRRA